LKKDIFNGKIKKEYFSYILVRTILFFLLFAGTGGMCIYASFRLVASGFMLAVFGSSALLLAFVFLFLELLVIFRFPKHEKLRRILFNSDCYFVGADSNEYRGGNGGITWRARTSRRFFDLNKTLSEAESKMGDKKPVRYTVYMVFSILFSMIGLAWLFGLPILFDKGAIFPNISDEIFLFLLFSVDIVFISFAIIFFIRVYKIAQMAPFEKINRKYELYSALVDISVRQNNKKLKYWYDVDQLPQIEDLLCSASEHAEVRTYAKNGKLVSFEVVDTLNEHVVFRGLFMQ
jgi:hypothetical protein